MCMLLRLPAVAVGDEGGKYEQDHEDPRARENEDERPNTVGCIECAAQSGSTDDGDEKDGPCPHGQLNGEQDNGNSQGKESNADKIARIPLPPGSLALSHARQRDDQLTQYLETSATDVSVHGGPNVL